MNDSPSDQGDAADGAAPLPAEQRTSLIRWLVSLLVLLVILIALGVAAYHVAVQRLQIGIEQALGPRSTVGEIQLGWNAVELHDVRVRADPKSWPSEDELRASRVSVVPELSSLLSGAWRVSRIDIDDAYVSILRTRAGKLRVLPALLETAADKTGAASPGSAVSAAQGQGQVPTVRIDKVRLSGATVDFYDASVRRPAHRMRIEQLHAQIGPLVMPELNESMNIDLSGLFKGPQRDGEISVHGRLTPATRDAKLSASLKHADLIALQPYLLKVSEGGVRHGTLDLNIDATVLRKRLHAPGRVTITGLELGRGGGIVGTFAGVPRQAVIAAMSRDGHIEVNFALEGSLDDPKFSLNELFAQRMAVGLAETLGVSVKGVVEGVGGVLKGLLGR